jgi:lysophospholipase L1-like esterase
LKYLLLLAIGTLSFHAGMSVAGPPERHVSNEVFAGKIRLILPKTIYAVPGVEMNVYFDNVVLAISPANYAFDVTCVKGTQQTERWTYIPVASDVGDYPFEIEVRDDQNKVIARAKSTLCVVPADAGAVRSITQLCIGDSLTHHSVYTEQLLHLFNQPGNPYLNLIGTHHPYENYPVENRHEGYGGWTAERFATYYTETARKGDAPTRGSPFLYPGSNGKPKLDFPRYLQEANQGKAPDVVTIFLGCNDVFHATDDDIESVVTKAVGFYDNLVVMIRSTCKNTKIGIVLIPPPAETQDAFGNNYGCGQTRWQYKRNQHHLVERLMQHFGNREKENIFLVPVFINLDCLHNYPCETVPCNAQTTQPTIRQNNGVHPATQGYRQIGDTIYCWMKYTLCG